MTLAFLVQRIESEGVTRSEQSRTAVKYQSGPNHRSSYGTFALAAAGLATLSLLCPRSVSAATDTWTIASLSNLIASPAATSAVPEPATLGLIGIGAIGLGALSLGARRRRA